MVAAPVAAADRSVWALDFDGVACDSVGESSLSAFKVGYCMCACSQPGSNASAATSTNLRCHSPPHPPRRLQAAAKLWPDVFQTPEAESRKGELVEKMRVVRPVVETGCVVPGSSSGSCSSGATAASGTSATVICRCEVQLSARRAQEQQQSAVRLCNLQIRLHTPRRRLPCCHALPSQPALPALLLMCAVVAALCLVPGPAGMRTSCRFGACWRVSTPRTCC